MYFLIKTKCAPKFNNNTKASVVVCTRFFSCTYINIGLDTFSLRYLQTKSLFIKRSFVNIFETAIIIAMFAHIQNNAKKIYQAVKYESIKANLSKFVSIQNFGKTDCTINVERQLITILKSRHLHLYFSVKNIFRVCQKNASKIKICMFQVFLKLFFEAFENH